MGSWDQRSVPTSTYEDGKGAECELRSTSRPDGHSATPAPGQPGRSLHELQRLCPPPLWSSPPGQDSPHYSRSNVRRPRAQGHPGLYPGLPEAAGTTLLLQTPHVIHQLSKLSQLEFKPKVYIVTISRFVLKRNMDLDTLQVFQRELTCSICMNCFLDPVTIDCGHSFCRPCLSLCWEEGQTPRSCPECSGLSERPDFKTNIVLKRLASLARQVRADHNHSSEEQICVTHQEAKGLFCEADQTLLCGPCSERPEHAAHSHRPIHRVAEESREKLMKRMRTLWKLREEMKISLNQEANKTQSFENYVALRKAMITVQYQRIPLLLQEDEKLHLEALEQEAKEICQLLKESVFKMTQQGEILREMYRELTEMCHKPDMELLQSLGSVPSCRSESVQLHLPQPVVPELSVWPMPGLIDWLRQFQVYIELHNERVTHYFPAFEDLRCLLAGPDGPDVNYTPPRSKYFLAWGAESFTSATALCDKSRNMSSKSFRNEVTCSLCVKYFIDPVTLGCGHSFCMPCLCLYWEEGQWPPHCPVCRETNHQLNLKTNTDLRKLVLLARQKGLYDLPNPAEEICEIHRYTKNFFCKVTKDVRCLLCCMSEQQGAPKHGSIQWTAEEYRSYVSTWKKMKQTEYRKVFHLVDHEEKHHLEKTEEESKEIFQQLKESQYNMDLKQKLLRQIYEELKDLCHKPDMELIQHYENMSKRGESVQLHMPRPVVPQLSAWPIPGLIDWLNQFQVYIALDNERVTRHVPVFEDLRRVQAGPDCPGVDYTPPRSKYFLAWGAESFTSGPRSPNRKSEYMGFIEKLLGG
ncbi:hypothetical protein MJG53_016608 [Ovis ammon polii x Ovis aries]|uniref:Uncharacterized protein n=1 Tax=Ovis ammon polii x Ovis aries TaxID=2918886 RepID=A0ACB9U8M5_9CETA|nr:hypothetical protein MJG53_016608 [Ovis ammon polii x Ovis aries]